MVRGLRPLVLLAPLWMWSAASHAEFRIHLPEHAMHMDSPMVTALMVVLLAIALYVIVAARWGRGCGAPPLHSIRIGTWPWIVMPVLVIGVDLTVAGNAREMLQKFWTVPGAPTLEVMVIGHQGGWEYLYTKSGVRLGGRFTAQDPSQRDAETRLLLPVGRPVRFLHISADVVHTFWVPDLGFKRDAIPGYLTETWTTPVKVGVYRGQCAEPCSTRHERMPIVVEVVSKNTFDAWLAQRAGEEKVAR